MARSAYTCALDLLAVRAYSAASLRTRLLRKQFPTSEIDAALQRLQENGVIDDKKFAVEFARQKMVLRGLSVRRVRQELAQRGIASSVAAAAVAQVTEEEPVDRAAAIRKMIDKKLPLLSRFEPTVKRRRLAGFLMRKGYELEDIEAAMHEVSL